MKICTKCRIEKPLQGFCKLTSARDGLSPHCRQCKRNYAVARNITLPGDSRARQKIWIERNRDKYRATANAWRHRNKERLNGKNKILGPARRRRQKYGLSVSETDEIVIRQNNSCAICQSQFFKPFRVDHCHKTGKVRGLLCAGCNIGIGHLRESIPTLRAAIVYLENHSSTQGPAVRPEPKNTMGALK